jgi:hypothetical protein
MSFLSQTFQAGSSNNTGSIISLPNSSDGDIPLPDPTPGNPSFNGGWVSAEKFAVIQCAIRSDTDCDLYVIQAFEPIDNQGITANVYNYTASGTQELITVYYYITLPWVKVYVANLETANTIFQLSTKLSLTPPPPSTTVQPISGTVAVSNFPATQAVSGSVAVSNFPAQQTVYGENGNYEFYATPATNIPAVYADETQGTDVIGGWRYTNTTTVNSKINWYCYGSLGASTDYKVSQLNSMYAVINQQSTLGLAVAQNPFVIIYTRMDSGTNNGAFYKNKLFFGSNADTNNTGLKLLYTGADPVGIHPEITGTSRIQLQFVLAQSTSTLALAQSDSIYLGSLQTTAVTPSIPAGSFDFTFQEFGVDWVKTPAILPIEFGAVQVGGEVSTLANRLQSSQTTTIGLGGSFTGTTFDLNENTVFDCLLLASGAITNGNVRIEYSLDGLVWIPDTGITITSTDPHSVVKGVKTSSRYIRVVKLATSTFQGTLAIYLSSCRI